MKKMDGKRVKGKDIQSTRKTKFDRVMKNLEWTITEKERSKNGDPAKGGRGSYTVY